MANESPPNDLLKSAWRNQPSEGIRMSVDEIRRRAEKFQKEIYWRNLRKYILGLVVIVYFGFSVWPTSDALARIGIGLTIAGALYVNWHLHRRGSSRSLPADLGLASGIEFYRRELERQRDLLDSVWAWCLVPIIPGFVIFIVAYHLHIGLSLATTALGACRK